MNPPTTNAQAGASAEIEHVRVFSGLTYEALRDAFSRTLRYLEPSQLKRLVTSEAGWSEVRREITAVGGTRGLMIIAQTDLGQIASLSGRAYQCALYLVGNPVIAETIIRNDRLAAFYVPFRVALVDDGDPRGASICFDRPSSFLATFRRAELDAIGKELDDKLNAVLAVICAR